MQGATDMWGTSTIAVFSHHTEAGNSHQRPPIDTAMAHTTMQHASHTMRSTAQPEPAQPETSRHSHSTTWWSDGNYSWQASTTPMATEASTIEVDLHTPRGSAADDGKDDEPNGNADGTSADDAPAPLLAYTRLVRGRAPPTVSHPAPPPANHL